MPPLPQGPLVLACRLIYDILRGPMLSGNDNSSTSNFMQRHSCTASHLQTRMPQEDETCFLLQRNKPSQAYERVPCNDLNHIATKEPKATSVRHRGGPSQLKEQADREVNLSAMLMRSREHSRGLNTNCKDEKEVCLGRKGKAMWSSLEALKRSSQTPGMLASAKDDNNS